MTIAIAEETSAIQALEEALVSALRMRVHSMSGSQLSAYLRQLHDANEELHKLASDHAVNYEMPGIGDAYALKFHLMRTDNLLVALGALTKKGLFRTVVDVLDLGSCTGSSAWALAAWSAASNACFSLASVEESREMRAADQALWRGLQRSSRISGGSVNRNDQATVCDVLVANHLFAVPQERQDERAQIQEFCAFTERVRQGGVVVIVTPDVEAKLLLTRQAVRLLAEIGFEVILDEDHAEPPKEVTLSKQQRPLLLCQLRREIDDLGESVGVGKIFREPEYDDPYFGFYGRLTILKKR